METSGWRPPGIDLDALREEERVLLGRLGKIQSILRTLGVDVRSKRPRKPGRPRVLDTRIRQIAEVLEDARKPLRISQIYQALRAQDPSLNWRDPPPVFRSYLRRQAEGPNKVVRMARGLYGLEKWSKTMPELVLAAGDDVRRPEPRTATKLEALHDILRLSGRPLHFREIHAKMKERCPGLEWKNPGETVYAMSRRSKGAIIHVGTGLWALAGPQEPDKDAL